MVLKDRKVIQQSDEEEFLDDTVFTPISPDEVSTLYCRLACFKDEVLCNVRLSFTDITAIHPSSIYSKPVPTQLWKEFSYYSITRKVECG